MFRNVVPAMPLLFLVVICVALFLGVVALLAFAAATERRQLRQLRSDPAARAFPLEFNQAFDPQHAILWSTQIPSLRLIESGGSTGIEYKRLAGEYQRTAASFPELYEGSSFAQWLVFLHRSGLVDLGSRRVILTPYGREFLHYCVEMASAA